MKTALLLALVLISASSCGVGTGYQFHHPVPAFALNTQA